MVTKQKKFEEWFEGMCTSFHSKSSIYRMVFLHIHDIAFITMQFGQDED